MLGPNLADDFVGVYYTNPSEGNRNSFYVWVVTRKANNRLGIGYYIEDTYNLGNQGAQSKKREAYFLESVVINGDSSFTINETVVTGTGTSVRLSGNGRLVGLEDGSAWIEASIDYIGSDNQAIRSSDRVSFQKVHNLLDEDEHTNDFDYAGNYATELPEGAKTAFHNWIVTNKSNTSFNIDYKIRDKFNQGTIAELINNYVLSDAKRVGNRSLSIDMVVEEEVSRDQIKIKAVGNKLQRPTDQEPRIAVVIQITNETQGITRIEYLEMRKQF